MKKCEACKGEGTIEITTYDPSSWLPIAVAVQVHVCGLCMGVGRL